MDTIYNIIKNLQNGKTIKQIVSIFLVIIGIIICLGILSTTYVMLRIGGDGSGSISNILSIISYLFCIVGIFIIFTYNAYEIKKIRNSSFTISMIAAVILRLTGETIAIFIITAGISALFGGPMSSLLGSGLFNNLLQDNFRHSGSAFLMGVLALIASFTSAFFILITFYFFAERLMVSTDMAINIRQLVDDSNKKTAFVNVQVCHNCKTPYANGDIFCENCGNKV